MNVKRLLKIAEHLEAGQLLHRNFDFSVVNANRAHGDISLLVANSCGTHGCAMGEFPLIFKRHFVFAERGGIRRNGSRTSNTKDIQDFLGINFGELFVLFYPDSVSELFDEDAIYRYNTLTGEQIKQFKKRLFKLGPRAKKEKVAANIREFIKIQQELFPKNFKS